MFLLSVDYCPLKFLFLNNETQKVLSEILSSVCRFDYYLSIEEISTKLCLSAHVVNRRLRKNRKTQIFMW